MGGARGRRRSRAAGPGRARRVLTLTGVVLAAVVLWCAEFTTAWQHEHSAVRVMLHAP